MAERALLTHLAIFNIVIACSEDEETISAIRAKVLTVSRADFSSDFIEALRTLGRKNEERKDYDRWKIYKFVLQFGSGNGQDVMWKKFDCRDEIKKQFNVDVDVKTISVVLREVRVVAGMVVDEDRMEM